MSITFHCQKCRVGMTVPDHLAGKRGKCKKCQAPIVVPTPAAAPAAPEPARPAAAVLDPVLDAEAAALAALEDPKEADKAPGSVEFECPQCNEMVKLPLEMAGKRHPCPSCTRVVPVPIPAGHKPAGWRDTGPKKPAGAKRDDVPVPEGAWGAGNAAGISQETMEEAGLIKEKDRPLTLYQKWETPILVGVPSVLLLVSGWLAWGWWNANTEQSAFNKAAALLTSQTGAALAGPGGLAALRSEAARYLLRRVKDEKAGPAARDHLAHAVGEARLLANPGRDALLLELFDVHLALGGPLKWDEAQRQIRLCLEPIESADARQMALRRMTAHLVKADEAARAVPLATQATASLDAPSRAEALATVALQLHADKQTALASNAAGMALAPYADVKGKTRPALRPAVVAAAIVTGKTIPAKLEKNPAEDEAERLGRIQAKAFTGDVDTAITDLGHVSLNKEAKCRGASLLLDAAPDKKAADAALALVHADAKADWANYRLGLAAGRAGADPTPAINAIQSPALKEWAALAVLRGNPGAAADALAAFGANTPAGLLARLELARLDGGATTRWKDWDEAAAAFGWMGAAQAMQGKAGR